MKRRERLVAGLVVLSLLLGAGVSRADDWSVKLAADKPSPQTLAAAGTVTFTASTVGSVPNGVEYQFMLYSSKSAMYTLMRGYGTAATWTWTPDAVDYYVVLVRARAGGAASSFQRAAALAFHVLAEAPVTAVTLGADKPSPQQVGTPVTFTATAVGGGSSGVEYQFWLYSAAGGAYRLVKDYAIAGNSWTTGAADMSTVGSYMVKVNARSKGSAMPYEKSASRSFIMVAQPPVTSVLLNVDKPSPQYVGTTVTFAATAGGGGVDGVEFQFWLYSTAGRVYRLVKDYPASDGTWTPGPGDMDAADCYVVMVYVRSKGSAVAYEKTAARNYCLVAQATVSAVTLSADKPSPQPMGTIVTFTATAAGGGTNGVEYQFWIASGTNGTFVPAGDTTTGYAAANTWHWTPPAPDIYSVMAYARSVGSIATYEKSATVSFTVTAAVATTCEGCHDGSYALAPNMMGDGTLPNGDPAHGTPRPYDDGSYGYNVNGHGRDADTSAISHGKAIAAACSDCHDVSVPAGRHLDGVLDGHTPSSSNGNPFHLVSGFINAAPANEWGVQVTFDDYCWTACHQGRTTDMRHQKDANPAAGAMEFGQHQSYAAPVGTPPLNMFYDANIAWLGAFNGPPNYGLCISCHNPHGTKVVSPRPDGNNKMMIYRWDTPAVLCVRCHT